VIEMRYGRKKICPWLAALTAIDCGKLRLPVEFATTSVTDHRIGPLPTPVVLIARGGTGTSPVPTTRAQSADESQGFRAIALQQTRNEIY
jgi:hypothetical protein